MIKNAAIVVVALLGSSAGFPARAADRICVSPSATLTISAAQCEESEGRRIAVVPGSRLFHWTNRDSSEIAAGVIGDGAESIDPYALAAVPISIRTAPERPGETTTLEVREKGAGGNRWTWQLPPLQLQRMTTLRLAHGSYELTVRAPHHVTSATTLIVGATNTRQSIALKASVTVSGKVVDVRTKEPLAGTVIALVSGKTLQLTDFDGSFEAELPETEQASQLSFSAGGYGTEIVPLPAMRGAIHLPVVELSVGGTLQVAVHRADELAAVKLAVDVIRKDGRQFITVRSGSVEGDRWVAKDLEAGDYLVTIKGDGALQRISEPVTIVGAEMANLSLDIRPQAMSGSVKRGSTAIPAVLSLKATAFGWTGSIQTDAGGAFAEDLWQPVRLGVTVASPALSAPYSFFHSLEGGEAWDIAVPASSVSGVVTDSASGKPIPQAQITLDSELSDGGTRSFGTDSDAEGRYAFDGLAAGTHRISPAAAGYAPATQQLSFVLNDGDTADRKIDLPMRATRRQKISVTGAGGAPLVRAIVIDANDPDPLIQYTDIAGNAEINIDAQRGATVFVVPETGSFAVVSVAPSRAVSDAAVRIVVPPGTATLRISVRDDSGDEPVQNVNVLIRYNGQLLPPAASIALERLRISLKTDRSGQITIPSAPAGFYELWPYGSRAEATRIMQSSMAPAATLGVTLGEHLVRLKLNLR
jgi:hypothetical protein